MKKLLSIGLVMIVAVYALLAQTKVAGNWQMSIETPHGNMQGPLKIQQDGSKLSGTYELEQMGTLAVTGTLEGDKVTMSMEVPGAGVTVVMTGKVDGNKMSGSSDHAGNWTATKQ